MTSTAIKRVLARQLEAAMKEKNVSRSEMARQMRTSRAALNRLLDPINTLRGPGSKSLNDLMDLNPSIVSFLSVSAICFLPQRHA